MHTTLGDRMKSYEAVWNQILVPRSPVILRCDGKAFHTLTAKFNKPFDSKLIHAMNAASLQLCKEIQGAELAYVQSDEISILLHGYKRFNSQPWFDNKVQKICSVAASITGVTFSAELSKLLSKDIRAVFDARVFTLPESEVTNYFYWRQQDWIRNSIQMLARSLYSQKQLHGKNTMQLQSMIKENGLSWDEIESHLKYGRCIVRDTVMKDYGTCTGSYLEWVIDNNIPVFKDNRPYIEDHLKLLEE